MAISLNSVNSEVVRAHKRIDSVGGVIETGSNTNGYYRKYSDGHIEMFGKITANGSNSAHNVTFSYSLSVGVEYVFLTGCSSVASGDNIPLFKTYSSSKTSMQIFPHGAKGHACYWYVLGK